MMISTYYNLFPLILSLVTYFLLYKEYKQRKANDVPYNYTWLKYLAIILGSLFLIMSMSYVFFKEDFDVILKSIIYVLHFIWLIGILVWIRKLNTKIA